MGWGLVFDSGLGLIAWVKFFEKMEILLIGDSVWSRSQAPYVWQLVSPGSSALSISISIYIYMCACLVWFLLK